MKFFKTRCLRTIILGPLFTFLLLFSSVSAIPQNSNPYSDPGSTIPPVSLEGTIPLIGLEGTTSLSDEGSTIPLVSLEGITPLFDEGIFQPTTNESEIPRAIFNLNDLFTIVIASDGKPFITKKSFRKITQDDVNKKWSNYLTKINPKTYLTKVANRNKFLVMLKTKALKLINVDVNTILHIKPYNKAFSEIWLLNGEKLLIKESVKSLKNRLSNDSVWQYFAEIQQEAWNVLFLEEDEKLKSWTKGKFRTAAGKIIEVKRTMLESIKETWNKVYSYPGCHRSQSQDSESVDVNGT